MKKWQRTEVSVMMLIIGILIGVLLKGGVSGVRSGEGPINPIIQVDCTDNDCDTSWIYKDLFHNN